MVILHTVSYSASAELLRHNYLHNLPMQLTRLLDADHWWMTKHFSSKWFNNTLVLQFQCNSQQNNYFPRITAWHRKFRIKKGFFCKIIHPCLPLPYYLQCSLNSYIIIFDICSGSGLYLSADHPLARSRLGRLLHPALAVQSAAHHVAATKIFGMQQKNIKTIPAGALLEFHPLSVFILVNLSAVPIGRAQHVVVLIAVILRRLSTVPPQLLKWPDKLVMFSKTRIMT